MRGRFVIAGIAVGVLAAGAIASCGDPVAPELRCENDAYCQGRLTDPAKIGYCVKTGSLVDGRGRGVCFWRARDGGEDAGADAGVDSGTDGGTDSGVDAGKPPSGSLDTTFGDGGFAYFDFGAPGGDVIHALATRVTGEIVLAGALDQQFGLTELNDLGRPNLAFGDGGFIRIATASFNGSADSLTIDSDGKALVASNALASFKAGQAQLSKHVRDGRPDIAFGLAGFTNNADGGPTVPLRVVSALTPDGKIVVAWALFSLGARPVVVTRFLGSGIVDTSFGGGQGFVILPCNPCQPTTVAVLGDNRIVVAMNVNEARPHGDVARLNVDGSFDTTFMGTGVVSLNQTATDSTQVNALLTTASGQIVVGGSYTSDVGNPQPVARISRLLSNGVFDANFGALGHRVVSGPGTKTISSLQLATDGSIVFLANDVSGDGKCSIGRMTATGFIDSTFGVGGGTPFSFALPAACNALALQPDGRIVVGGGGGMTNTIPPTGQSAVARFWP